jgi:hypothetical protein
MRYAILVALLLGGCAESAMQRANRECPVRAKNQAEYMDCMRFYQQQQLIDGQNAAAAAAANAAMMQGSAALIDASRPRPMFPAPAFPVQTHCYRNGNYVNCSSY